MKIDSSAINMNKERLYTNSTETRQSTLMKQAGTGAATYSSTSFLYTYMEYSGSANANQTSGLYDEYINTKETPDNQDSLNSDLYTNLANKKVGLYDVSTSFGQFHKNLMARLEQMMEQIKQQLLGLGSSSSSIVDLTSGSQPGSLWTRQDTQSITQTESEITRFDSKGSVVTADGRAIDFNISMEMSRSFTETSEVLSTDTQYILTDPLVIQLDNVPDTISDQKWFFDIDGDGKKEEISKLKKGNAFLAMDKNNNGKIDDGSELFGTKSGNGFKDLAAYDEDGNGWIDENDSAYSKLKIWVKDDSGNDKLMDLKQADIGAIYLGSANTEFSHKSADTNETQAVVRQTGFYLHESTGAAGTVQQIDFATKNS